MLWEAILMDRWDQPMWDGMWQGDQSRDGLCKTWWTKCWSRWNMMGHQPKEWWMWNMINEGVIIMRLDGARVGLRRRCMIEHQWMGAVGRSQRLMMRDPMGQLRKSWSKMYTRGWLKQDCGTGISLGATYDGQGNLGEFWEITGEGILMGCGNEHGRDR